jgi:chromosome segregation ATPase
LLADIEVDMAGPPKGPQTMDALLQHASVNKVFAERFHSLSQSNRSFLERLMGDPEVSEEIGKLLADEERVCNAQRKLVSDFTSLLQSHGREIEMTDVSSHSPAPMNAQDDLEDKIQKDERALQKATADLGQLQECCTDNQNQITRRQEFGGDTAALIRDTDKLKREIVNKQTIIQQLQRNIDSLREKQEGHQSETSSGVGMPDASRKVARWQLAMHNPS